ncbi:MAG: HNH endonuclease [Bacteroidales bacterium]|nr:HNH endonuclease [Bacteroidales bacterium]
MAHSIYLSKLTPQQHDELIKRLWECQKGKCYISGKDIDLDIHKNAVDIDHIIPLTNGGKDDESNMALTFSVANRSKQAADLNLARINWTYKTLAEDLQNSENRNPNLNDVLKKFDGACHNLHFVIKGDRIRFSYAELGNLDIVELPIYEDKKGGVRYFFALLPIQYLFHDDKINPRSIGSNVSKLLAEFYKGNPQLHISLGYIETNDNNESPVKLFDGQHKAAAQILLGTREIPVRVFINPDKDKIIETNFNAGTTLKQVAFDKSIQRHLGNALYQDRVGRYQKQTGRDASDFSFSEKTLINYYKGESREMKRYIIDSVKDGITYNDENKLREYIDMGGRAKEKPLSYSTVEKTFYSFFISPDALETNIDFKLEEGLNPRDLEKKQIVRLMNIIAEKILIGKYDFEVGTYRIENKIQQGDDSLDWNHVAAYRMMKEEIIYAWLSYISDVVSMFFANMGKRVANRHDFFQEEFPSQLWVNIENFIENLANLPLWKNKELSLTIFGGKQVYSFWKTIFEKGIASNGEQVLANPIDIKTMIAPPIIIEVDA